MSSEAMLEAAIAYARRGFAVFPLHTPDPTAPTSAAPDGELLGGCDCRKSTCSSPGKHPRTRNGLHDASADPAMVQRWWGVRWPRANIGIVCGRGFVVLDVDPRHDGDHSLELLERKYGRLPETATVRTGSGGWHHYLGGAARNAKSIAAGIDLQSGGSYVVAPPSVHVSGHRYEWERRCGLAPVPPWVVELAGRARACDRGAGAVLDEVIPTGKRNEKLFKVGCAMRRHGLSEKAILAALLVENADRCAPPLPHADVVIIAKQAAQYAPGERQA